MSISTTGPVMGYLGPEHPTGEELHLETVRIFSNWHCLCELYTSRVVLTDQVAGLLGALRQPLTKINLYSARLSGDDISYLARSHHIEHLQQIEIAYNDFRGKGEELCDMLRNASSLAVLGLKMSLLRLHEKIQVMQVLQNCLMLHTLAMYENEDMLSTSGYETIVDLACAVPSLQEFYIFPIEYKPFALFFRSAVWARCCEILCRQNRTDLKLFY